MQWENAESPLNFDILFFLNTPMIGSKKKVVDAFKEEKFAALWGHFLDFSENLKSGHFVLQISP